MLIYKITNKITGKNYIGITRHTAEKRLLKHIERAEEGVVTALYCAMRKYGYANFTTQVICEAVDDMEALVIERALIASHNTLLPNGYNMKLDGPNPYRVNKVKGTDQWKSTLNEEIVQFIRDPSKKNLTNSEMVDAVNLWFSRDNIGLSAVNSARAGRTWKHLNKEYPPIYIGLGGRTKEYFNKRNVQ